MSTVRPKPLRNYFRTNQEEVIKEEYKKAVLYSARKIINPVTFFTSLTVISAFMGFFDHRLFYLALFIPILLFVLYQRTLKIAGKINITRTVPDQASRNQLIEVTLKITNGSGSTISDFVVRDRFNGSKNPQAIICVLDAIKSGQQWDGHYRKTCNAGMGEFYFDELEITMTDPMGVFEFTIKSEVTDTIMIFPIPTAIPQLPIAPETFLESFTHGLYDSPRKGTFANFVGIREYIRGDSMRHISWKSTAKVGKLMVKEFESVCNTDVSIFLDMSIGHHCGTDQQGSWDMAKDAALALLAQQLENGNQVQFFSQDIHVSRGGGPAHATTITRQVFKLRPAKDSFKEELIARYLAEVSEGTVAVYIRSIFPTSITSKDEAKDIIATMNRLRVRDIQAFCILIDSGSFLRLEEIPGISTAQHRQIQESGTVLQTIKDDMLLAGIPTYVLRMGRTLGDALLGTRESP